MEFFGVIIVFIVLAVFIRLGAGSLDGARIEAYIRKKGWKLVDRSWDPFGPGWFGEKDSRIYQVVYEDESGNTHKAHVKTSLLSGVYLTNDVIVNKAGMAAGTAEEQLQQENERLKQRIHELESREH